MVFRAVPVITLFVALSSPDSHSFTVNSQARLVHKGICRSAGPVTLVGSIQLKKDDDMESTIENADLVSFGSLDSMLEKARRREGIHLQFKLQAFWDTPVLTIRKPYPYLNSSVVITVGDTGLSAIALYIGAKGFALGYILGKISAGPFREILRPNWQIQSIMMPLWSVLWAIGLDQLL